MTRFAPALALVAALAVAGCGSASSSSSTSSKPAPKQASKPAAPSSSATVDIRAFKYKPVTVAVTKGGRVKWVNADAAAHTSTADDRSFDTQTIERGKSRTVTFTKAGTFAYHCDFHPFMKATVVVR
jgi:plastocyanin